MKLLFSCGRSFLPGLEITIASLVASTRWSAPIEIFVAGHDFAPPEWEAARRRLLAFDRRLRLSLADPGLDLWAELTPTSPPGFGYFGWLSAVEKNFSTDRVLVLDADLLIARDVFELHDHDLGGHPLGACLDVRKILARDCPDPELIRSHGDAPYFNSGFVLIDAAAWRRERVFARCLAFARRWGTALGFLDQPLINAVLRGGFAELPWAWNVTHEHAGWVDGPQPPLERIDQIILHIWKQWKPWTGLNFAWSGAAWYGLARAYCPSEFDYRRMPGARKTALQRSHPRLTALIHQVRGHRDVAAFWRERHAELGGREWVEVFPHAVANCQTWWTRRLTERFPVHA